MRKPKIENKYNLKFSDIRRMKVIDRSQICEGVFWRNNSVRAWCISGTTIKTPEDSTYGTYSEYWIGIQDNDKIRAHCSSHGGMCGYNFEEFFRPEDIENAHDLETQEGLLDKLNYLLDNGIVELSKEV